jgi:hypothetical protein
MHVLGATALLLAASACASTRSTSSSTTSTTTSTAATTTSTSAAAPAAGVDTLRADALDRTRRPALAAPPTLDLPPAQERTLPNGLRLVVVEHHELPVVDAALLVHAGTEADPVGKEGLATLTAALLDEGTATRSALAIADQVSLPRCGVGHERRLGCVRRSRSIRPPRSSTARWR